MQDIPIWTWLLVIMCSAAAATLAVTWVSFAPRRRQPSDDPFGPASPRDPIFLFDRTTLLDASASGAALLARAPERAGWDALHQVLVGRFPGFPHSPELVRDQTPMIIASRDPSYGAELCAEWVDGITRVHLRSVASAPTPAETDPHRLALAEQELDSLRRAMDGAPYPIWQINDQDAIIWHNTAYKSLCIKVRGKPDALSKPIFDLRGHSATAGERIRISVPVEQSEDVLWYDVLVVQQDSHTMYYAMDINAVVGAEIAQRNFVQTLAKTFAQLSIGLAIFDRNRQLALFNPALIDLTALPAEFLSARPNLLSFFDRLRDNRMMPEPKNYQSWRQQMAELVEAAADGRYQDTWSLPSGSIYKVSGRPHPDGAVAFLFEDITAEVSLTRRFRSELELGQSILDQLDDAIAVFQPSGVLTMTNQAYRQLWGVDPDSSFADVTIVDATRIWQSKCRATPVWGELRDFVLSGENRAVWTSDVEIKDGHRIKCTVSPVQNGATMVAFRSETPVNGAIPAPSSHPAEVG